MTVKRPEDTANNPGNSEDNTLVSDSETGITMAQVVEILEHWSLARAQVTLAAHRENTVYRIDAVNGKSYALRIRRAGYRSDSEIHSEHHWMSMLATEGLTVPEPVTALDGKRLVCIGRYRADLVTWLNGEPLGRSGETLKLKDPITTFRSLGKTAARLHLLSDQWTLPARFERPHWDNSALLGNDPLWGRFWDCAGLTTADATLLSRFREAAEDALTNVRCSLDTGLIHADLVGENVLLDPTNPQSLALIDFDDGAFGYRLFELATALGKNVNDPQYSALREALLEGYCELRPIDISALDLFMAIRASTYVGWSAARKTEPGGDARAERAIRAARVAATHWLNLNEITRT